MIVLLAVVGTAVVMGDGTVVMAVDKGGGFGER